MLRLIKLRFKGIGRFVEEQTIYFDALGNLIQVDGKNLNTKGSSGAGKSTIFNALDYLFGVNKIPGTVLKSRQSEEGIFVEGTFLYDDKPLIITRGKKFSIVLDGEPTIGNSTKTEEKLDEILSIPRDLFRKMYHKKQKEGGFFLQMTPKEIEGFLMSALGLGKWKAKIKILEDRIKLLAEKKLAANSLLNSAQSAYKATQDAILALGLPPKREISRDTILDLKNKADKSAAEWKVLSVNQQMELNALELTRPKVDPTYFDRSTLDALEGRLTELKRSSEQMMRNEKSRQVTAHGKYRVLEAEVQELRRAAIQGPKAMERIKEISSQLKAIKDGKCFNCGQDWPDKQKEEALHREALKCRGEFQDGARAQEALLAMEVKLQHLSTELKEIIPPELQQLTEEISSLECKCSNERRKEKEHQTDESIRQKIAHDTFAKSQALLRQKHSLEAEQVRGQMDLDRRAFEMAANRFKAEEEAVSRYDASCASLKAQEASYSEKVTKQAAEADALRVEADKADELRRGLKSWLSCSFDEALETIGENATKLIRFIPNMANATIQLSGTYETQDGKINEEVNAIIHMDGEENIDIRSLCGGERTSADLAIDLSVIDLLESRANKGIDVFILDEPFEGLDTVCIEMALEVLKNSNSNKRLIIVDHNPEVKEMVESRLVVVREGATSKIVQAA